MPSWKGKERAREVFLRDEDGTDGDGGADGIVLPLNVVGSGIYDVAYTIPVKFGDNQQFSLQVDTGSSDLWVASKQCSTSSCALTKGRLYDPSGSRATGQDFSIPYLQGSASGPIVWEKIALGGYTIDNQALAAADNVDSEPLDPAFSGILGLALPLNSIIAQDIPPVTNNNPDGAAWASNLFSITPTSQAPSARFLSLSLARPGSDAVPSLLGIGRHPSGLVPDPSAVQYDSLVSEREGTLFWKASVRAITVYVDGVPKPVSLGRSVSGAVFPSAVLDSGVPLILTTSSVANAIYGALGVRPADDGTYYVPCTTPLNLSITLDSRPETPIHPLDLTAEPPDDNQAAFCVGLIQPADGVLTTNTAVGDMILGVPFLRNVYMVMGYTPPTSDGSFPPVGANVTDANNDSTASRISTKVTPMLGLLPLTDPTRALQEFNTVRVLNQPLPSSSSTSSPNPSSPNSNTITVGGKRLSVGLVVLIGLLSFFAFCCFLFGLRWVLFRRKFRKARAAEEGDGVDKRTAYRLARRGSLGALGVGALGVEEMTEDERRLARYRSYVRKSEKGLSESTVGSDRTLAVVEDGYGEFTEWGKRTSKSKDSRDSRDEEDGELVHEERPLVDGVSPPASPDQALFPLEQTHARTYSSGDERGHRSVPSVQVPLLESTSFSPPISSTSTVPPPTRTETQSTLSAASLTETSDPIIAHHARLFSVDPTGEDTSVLPIVPPTAMLRVVSQPARQDSDVLEFGALPRTSIASLHTDGDTDTGTPSRTSMAGIGSAARFGAFGVRPSIDSLPFNRESLMSVSSVGSTRTLVPLIPPSGPSGVEQEEDVAEERRLGS